MSNWISVKDKLPENDRYVIGSIIDRETSKYKKCDIVNYSYKNNLWYIRDRVSFYEIVTHWMHLPEPPND